MCSFKFQINQISKLNFRNVSGGSGNRVELPKRKTFFIGKDGPVTWKTLGITGILGTGMVAYLWYLKEEQEASERFFLNLIFAI